MLTHTIFNTPIVTWCARQISRLLYASVGWSVKGHPPDVRKCIYICVPHTSNWDFAVMLAVCFIMRIRSRWIGKHTLFPFGLGWFMVWLGGVPIDRRKRGNMVEQMQEHFENNSSMELVITPEGTRSKVAEWKSGFYRIAVAANVPIIMVAVHAPGKFVIFNEPFHPTGDYETDMVEIMKFYEGMIGFHPENT